MIRIVLIFILILHGSCNQVNVDANGETVVWINAYCDSAPPHRGIRFVHDGGDCYWQVKVNLTRKKIYDLSINGEA